MNAEFIKDTSHDFNSIIDCVSEEHIKDPEIVDALLERFSKSEYSEGYDLNQMKEHPEMLLERLDAISFENDAVERELSKSKEAEKAVLDDAMVEFGFYK